MPIEDAVSGTTSATTLAKPGSPRSRAYVTFLDGNSKCVTGVVGLAESLRKVNTSYRLVVAVLPGVPEEHRSVLVAKDCIVREIEPVHVPKNQTQFAMAEYGINYSKLRIWEFDDYYKMIYLDGDTLVSENIDFLFDLPNGYFYAVNAYFCGKTGSHTPQYQIGYQWPAEWGPKAPLYFNAGMFVFEPSLSIYDDLLNNLKGTHPTPFAEQDFLNMFFKDVYKPIPPISHQFTTLFWPVDKIKMSNDWQVEKIIELEFRPVDAEAKAAEAERKLQSMEQEFGSLKAEKEQLANALAISEAKKEQLANALAIAEDSIEAAKHEGCNEATAVYEAQFARLQNMFFENGWTSALDEANVPADSDLRENVPYPRPEIAGRENDVAEGAEARDTREE